MREWKKIKNELQKYEKFEALYKKLKDNDLKEYEERINKEIVRKREIIDCWTSKNVEYKKEF